MQLLGSFTFQAFPGSVAQSKLIFLCNLQSLVEQAHGFFWVIFNLHVHEIHVDGRHILVIACLLHHIDDLAEDTPCGGLVAAVAVDVPQDVVGHIHLFVDTLLAQFSGEFSSKGVCLEDFLLVHQEDDLVAALGVIGVQVVLFQKIVF